MDEKKIKRRCKICSTEYSIGHKYICASDDCWNEYFYRLECKNKRLFSTFNLKSYSISDFTPTIKENIFTDDGEKD